MRLKVLLAVTISLTLTPSVIAHSRGSLLTPETFGLRSASLVPEGLPLKWCGEENHTDRGRAGVRNIKWVYAYPADQPNRFRLFASLLQADAAAISRYLAAHTGFQKSLSFSMGTECGANYLDIQSVALPQGYSHYYTSDAAESLNRAAADIHAKIPRADFRNLVVYLDGAYPPTGLPTRLGSAEAPSDFSVGLANQSNLGKRFAVVWGPYQWTPTPTRTYLAPEAFLHEILHTLGAVPKGSPNSSGARHCNDGLDVMCYADGGPTSNYRADRCPGLNYAIKLNLDCNRDDYFNPLPQAGAFLASHWNLYDSLFLTSCAFIPTACGSSPLEDLTNNPVTNPDSWSGSSDSAPLVTSKGKVLGSVRIQATPKGEGWQLKLAPLKLKLTRGKYRFREELWRAYPQSGETRFARGAGSWKVGRGGFYRKGRALSDGPERYGSVSYQLEIRKAGSRKTLAKTRRLVASLQAK